MFSPETKTNKKPNSNIFIKPKYLAVKYSPIIKNVQDLESPIVNFDQPTVKLQTDDYVQKQNIFSVAKSLGDEFELANRGPKTSKNGTIVSYSILGKVDWFKNHLLTKENENKMQQVTPFSETPDTQKLPRPTTSYVGNQNKSAFSTQQRPFSSKPFSDKRNFEDSHKNNEKIIILKKEEVLEEINKIKERIHKNSEPKTRRISLSAKLYQNKDKKCLKNFDDLEKKWEIQSKIYSKKLARNQLDQALFEKGECFRQKLELAQVVDHLRTDHEKYGDHYWEITLRKYANQIISNEIPEKRTLRDLRNQSRKGNELNEKIRPISSQVEAIRNPKRHYNEMPFSSFKSENYLKQKLECFEEKILDMHSLINPHQINSFYVFIMFI